MIASWKYVLIGHSYQQKTERNAIVSDPESKPVYIGGNVRACSCVICNGENKTQNTYKKYRTKLVFLNWEKVRESRSNNYLVIPIRQLQQFYACF